MTAKEWIADTDNMVKLIDDAKFMLPIIQTTHNGQVQRIFVKGIAGDENKIGKYSDKKTGIYINPKLNLGSFEPKGKDGDKVFKTGKKSGESHKTKYFDNYKAYRGAIGRETSFVNLRLTELLKIDYSNSLRFENGRVTSSVNSAGNVGKVLGAIDKYGEKTFSLTKKEMEDLSSRFGLAILKQIRKA